MIMEDEIEEYGDLYITSKDAKVPLWLKVTYCVLPIWGIICFFLFWNGATGWLDGGSWPRLQKAANTTFPHDVNGLKREVTNEKNSTDNT